MSQHLPTRRQDAGLVLAQPGLSRPGLPARRLALIAFGVWYLAHNTLANMRARGIQSGFDFLAQPAGFDIGETLITYDALDPYWKAFLVGVLNTLRVAIVGIILATILGTLLGIGRFSRNALVRGLCYGYVELFRNVPVLLQLLMWYLLFTELLPDRRRRVELARDVLPEQGGLSLPDAGVGPRVGAAAVGALVGLRGGHGLPALGAATQFEQTGQPRSLFWVPLAIVARCRACSAGSLGGAPTAWMCRSMRRLPVEGGGIGHARVPGGAARPGVLHAAFIAEVVRAGIASVSHGQIEAAGSLGLSRAPRRCAS